MDTATWGAMVVGLAGAASGMYAASLASRAQRRSASAEEKAQAFEAADHMIGRLQEDNLALRTQLRAERAERTEADALLRLQAIENDSRNAAAIAALRLSEERCLQHLSELTQQLLLLRNVVVNEVANEAATDALGRLNHSMVAEVLHEMNTPPGGYPATDPGGP